MDKRVLLVDDDEKLLKLLREYLEGNGFEVSTLPDGRGVSKTIQSKSPDMVILDIMMPHKDGLEVLREIRSRFTLPVIMLTAKGEDTERIVGLELGADDYVSKPFNPRELLARMKAVFRRSTLAELASSLKMGKMSIEVGGLFLNTAKRELVVNDQEIELSTAEFNILKVLMEHPNVVLSRDQLMDLAFGRDFMAFDRTIDVHISKLRAKVEADPRSPKRIKTVWGTGYMLVDAP